jgi:hypothetical protein
MCAETDSAAEPGWSPARTELLRLHYRLGLSASLSAQLIGRVSKNAVISKRRRLGLTGANPLQVTMREAGWTTPGFGAGRLPRYRPPRAEVHGRGAALPVMDEPPLPGTEPKTLAHRARGECAWPLGPAEAIGDYRTLFCCAPAEAGRSYCAIHRTRSLSGEVLPPLKLRPVEGLR